MTVKIAVEMRKYRHPFHTIKRYVFEHEMFIFENQVGGELKINLITDSFMDLCSFLLSEMEELDDI